MLNRVEHFNGVVTYQSPLLEQVGSSGLRHGFSTRIGGLSEGVYAALNLGSLAKGEATDANALVAENFRRLRAALQLEQVMRVTVRQVHGNAVWHAPLKPVPAHDAPEADAIVSGEPKQMLTIRTADCVPILMATSDGKYVAAVHAGWRGVVANVVATSVVKLCQIAHASPRDVVAAIGPCISVERFEVGEEVAAQFDAAGLSDVVVRREGSKPHVDLQAAVKQQLITMNLLDDQIEGHGLCTHAMAQEFYSYRRDGEPTGRMAAVIASGG